MIWKGELKMIREKKIKKEILFKFIYGIPINMERKDHILNQDFLVFGWPNDMNVKY